MTDANFSYDRPMMNQPVSIYTKEENLFTREAGEKHYELTDHLGNVRVVISDVKLNRDTAGGPNSFIADVKAVYNYLPFGFPTPGRNYFGANAYRWGFNGQEKDDEITGSTGSHYTAEFWEYDTRIGRRWNIDPVDKPWMSSYHAFSNNPIWKIDPNGAEDTKYVDEKGQTLYETEDKLTDVIVIKDKDVKTFENKLNELNDKGTINSADANKKELHTLGTEISELKQKLGTGEPTFETGYTTSYEKKNSILLDWFYVAVSFAGPEGVGMRVAYERGKEKGKKDVVQGKINIFNPYESLKRNEPIIKLKK